MLGLRLEETKVYREASAEGEVNDEESLRPIFKAASGRGSRTVWNCPNQS
jgi:hypothetical protein